MVGGNLKSAASFCFGFKLNLELFVSPLSYSERNRFGGVARMGV